MLIFTKWTPRTKIVRAESWKKIEKATFAKFFIIFVRITGKMVLGLEMQYKSFQTIEIKCLL